MRELRVDFQDRSPGPYTADNASADWGAAAIFEFHEERLDIDAGNLLVTYPRDKISPRESGTQFKVRLDDFSEAYCDYRFRFESGFAFTKGGKLPGLAGGTATTGCVRPIGDGWSARCMWREEGRLIAYPYHLGQAGDCGDVVELGCSAQVGEWIRMTQFVRVNGADASDGILRVWVNGDLKLDRRDFEFRTGDAAPVNRFLFSTFFGGSTLEWAPSIDCRAKFDDFRIGRSRPDGLEPELV